MGEDDDVIHVRFTESRLAFKRWHDPEYDCLMAQVEAEYLDRLENVVSTIRVAGEDHRHFDRRLGCLICEAMDALDDYLEAREQEFLGRHRRQNTDRIT